MRSMYPLLVLAAFLASCRAAAQYEVTVDMSAPKKEVAERPVGINLFMLMDHDDAEHRTVPMYTAMRNLGVKSIRFNEGEYGDWYLFTHPDSLHLLDKPGAPLYPYLIDIKSKGIDGQLTDIDAPPSYPGYPLNREGFRPTVDFNDFIELCRLADAPDATVIIPTHPMEWDGAPGFYPSREDMVKMAAAWVRYANITMKCGFRFWEIGNEHYWENNNDAYDAEWAVKCAGLALEMAKAMKQVDPTIEVGINGFTDEWLGAMLHYEDKNGRLVDYIDNIIPHQYAKPEIIGSYEKYLATGEYGLHEVDEAVKAVNELNIPDAAARERMKVQVTEASSFMAGSPALKVDNVAWVALANFEHLGYILAAPLVEYVHFWATHWTDDKTYWSALKMDNTIAPMGWGVKLWNDHLRDNIWKADLSGNTVRCYASSSSDGDALSIFLVNKSAERAGCTVKLTGYEGGLNGRVSGIYALTPEDRDFTVRTDSPMDVSREMINISLDPLSVTVIELD